MVQERIRVKSWNRELLGVLLRSAGLAIMLWALYIVPKHLRNVIDLNGLIEFIRSTDPAGPLMYCANYLILAMKGKVTDSSGSIHLSLKMSGAIRNASAGYYRAVAKESWQSKDLESLGAVS